MCHKSPSNVSSFYLYFAYLYANELQIEEERDFFTVLFEFAIQINKTACDKSLCYFLLASDGWALVGMKGF